MKNDTTTKRYDTVTRPPQKQKKQNLLKYTIIEIKRSKTERAK